MSLAGITYFFVSPRNSWVVEGSGNQLALTMFFFCGVCCAALGEAQRFARRRAQAALAEALAQRGGLEEEVARRKGVEFALRQREADLLDLNAQFARSERAAADVLSL